MVSSMTWSLNDFYLCNASIFFLNKVSVVVLSLDHMFSKFREFFIDLSFIMITILSFVNTGWFIPKLSMQLNYVPTSTKVIWDSMTYQ